MINLQQPSISCSTDIDILYNCTDRELMRLTITEETKTTTTHLFVLNGVAHNSNQMIKHIFIFKDIIMVQIFSVICYL